ncbi:hypothetical protein BJ878DRAFT_476280 [Calycina marina]|uniref:Peptidase M24 domain-containing protein n=1 Tax=Calycina marina TaxID=1763456 RepID=A0A9P8CJ98_9HELO|nr:hypothetical protein BJ878DRAFT_476280 [Calycina marina]
MDDKFLSDYRQVTEVHGQVLQYSQTIIIPGKSLIQIVVEIEEGYTPNSGFRDIVLKHDDVIGIDFGVHINGRIIDSTSTMTFEETDPIYDNLLASVEDATNTGIRHSGIDVRMSEIGSFPYIFSSYSKNLVKYNKEETEALGDWHEIQRTKAEGNGNGKKWLNGVSVESLREVKEYGEEKLIGHVGLWRRVYLAVGDEEVRKRMQRGRLVIWQLNGDWVVTSRRVFKKNGFVFLKNLPDATELQESKTGMKGKKASLTAMEGSQQKKAYRKIWLSYLALSAYPFKSSGIIRWVSKKFIGDKIGLFLSRVIELA